MNGSALRNHIVGIDTLMSFLAMEEVRQKLDNAGNARGIAEEVNFVHDRLVDLRIAQDVLNGLQRRSEQVL